MVLIRMLVKRQQHIGLVPGAEHFARADAHLENRRPAGNRRGDGHERHDLLFAASGKPRQETANGLNPVLRIAGNADHRLGNVGNLGRSATGWRGQSCVAHEMS